MRVRMLAIVLVALGSGPARAQGGPFSFELGAGHGSTSDIFRQDVSFPADPPFSARVSSIRLSLGGGSVGSARVGYRIGAAWFLVGALADGSTRYEYDESFADATGVHSTYIQTGDARRTSFSVGVARRSTLGIVPLFIEPDLGVALQRLRVGHAVQCVPTAPTLGGGGPSCIPSERWERTYSAPSIAAGLTVGYAILPHVGVQVRGQYSLGRTSTAEGFYEDLLPQYDWMEAPRTQTIRASQLSVGLRISP